MEIKEYEVVRTQEDSIKLNDSDVKYTFAFEKGTFEDGTEITAFSYVAGGENRPVLFLTNGGPGSGVVWLHIGFCAPKRIHMDDDLHPQMCPPFYLEDNPNTLIDMADLVFIDPPGAGYSSINEEHKKDYASVDGDACAVARFIERWRIEHNATNKPTYFMGESYGTVRGPALLDMCTVPGGVHYVVSQSDLDLNRVDIKEYCSGHMAYFGEENASQMSKDIRKFIGK